MPDIRSGLLVTMALPHPQSTSPNAPLAADSGWSDAELLATVNAYRELFERVRSGLAINKAATYRGLSEQFGRTPGAYERRMQNISAVLNEIGAPWLPGLLPMRNIGTHVRPRLVKMVRDAFADDVPSTPAYEPEVIELLSVAAIPRPLGSLAPATSLKETKTFARDAAVKAWVLRQARGRCECCLEPAPFHTLEGLPYLEVHHLQTLANGGADVVENTVALCPNCHRRLHYGSDASELRQALYARVERLRGLD